MTGDTRPACRYCIAAWGDTGFGCEHTEREQDLARQLAERVHKGPATDKQVGWFMADAEEVDGWVPGQDRLVLSSMNVGAKTRLVVNGHQFVVDDEDGLHHRGVIKPKEATR